MPMIKESFQFAASNVDILAAPSRLTAIPRSGLLTIEATCTDSDAANRALITLQLPGGEIPFEDLIVPVNGFSTADSVMHNDTSMVFAFRVAQGGHVLYQYTEVGATTFFTIVTLEF